MREKKLDINTLKKKFDKTEKKIENLREAIEKYFPGADADKELLKVAMRKIGKERTIEAFKEAFDNWSKEIII